MVQNSKLSRPACEAILRCVAQNKLGEREVLYGRVQLLGEDTARVIAETVQHLAHHVEGAARARYRRIELIYEPVGTNLAPLTAYGCGPTWLLVLDVLPMGGGAVLCFSPDQSPV